MNHNWDTLSQKLAFLETTESENHKELGWNNCLLKKKLQYFGNSKNIHRERHTQSKHMAG